MDKKLAVQQLAEVLAKRLNLDKKNSEIFVRTFFETISEALTRDKLVKIKGFGTFKMIDVSDRESINVNTGERIRIAGHPKVTFTPDAALRDQVNKPFSAFETTIINEGVDIASMEAVPEEDDTPTVLMSSEQEAPTETVNELDVIVDDGGTPEVPVTELDASSSEVAPVSPIESAVAPVVSMPTEEPVATEDEPVVISEQPAATAEESPESPSEDGIILVPEETPAENAPVVEPVAAVESPVSPLRTVQRAKPLVPITPKQPMAQEAPVVAEESPQVPVVDVAATEELSDSASQVNDAQIIPGGIIEGAEDGPSVEEAPAQTPPTRRLVRPTLGNGTLQRRAPQTVIEPKATAPAQPENVPTPSVEQKQDAPKVEPAKAKSSGTHIWVHLLYILVIILVAAGAYYAGSRQLLKPYIDQVLQLTEAKQTAEVEASSATTADTPVRKVEKENPAPAPKKEVEVDASIPQYEGGSYIITGTKVTHVFSRGDNLWKLARQYYDDKNVWELVNYIIFYNQFPDPENIADGTEVKIPELKKKD